MYRPFTSGAQAQSLFIDVESTIRGLTQDYNTAFNTGNYEQVAELFAADGLFMPPHREAAQGPKAIERVLRDHGETGYQDLRLETMRVDSSGDMAIEIGRYSLAVRQGNGTTLADRGKFIHAWRRLGVWLMVAACWSSDLPPAS
jgi:uncharacterized protein (TIGR02246 family)